MNDPKVIVRPVSNLETGNATAYYRISPVVGRDTENGPGLQIGHD